jgi:hypothetical protein
MMEWDDNTRGEQAALLRWLADEYESGRLTRDVKRRYESGRKGEFGVLEVVRAITDLAHYAEGIAADDE